MTSPTTSSGSCFELSMLKSTCQQVWLVTLTHFLNISTCACIAIIWECRHGQILHCISTLGLVNYVIILALSSGFQGTENWSIGEKAVSIQCSLIPKCRMCVCVCVCVYVCVCVHIQKKLALLLFSSLRLQV